MKKIFVINKILGGRIILVCGLLWLLGLTQVWGRDYVTFLPMETITIKTQGNRILCDLSRFPSKKIGVYVADAKIYRDFVTNATLMLDVPPDYLLKDQDVFIYSNTQPGKSYQFFFTYYDAKRPMFYLSGVYRIDIPVVYTAEQLEIIAASNRPKTNFVTNTLYFTNTITNIIIQKVFDDISLQATVDPEKKTINLRSSFWRNPTEAMLYQVEGGRTNQIYRTEKFSAKEDRETPFAFHYVLSNAARGQGYRFFLIVRDKDGRELYSRSTDISFGEGVTPFATNAGGRVVYPQSLSQYQPLGHLDLYAVANLFWAGQDRDAWQIFSQIRRSEKPDSSFLFWKATLEYSVNTNLEAAITGFYDVIRMNSYRAEVFLSYLWLSKIFLQEQSRNPKLLEMAETYLKNAYAFEGDSRYKDDILYHQAEVYFYSGQKKRLEDHLRFIRNTKLVNALSTYYDLTQKKELEILPALRALENP